MQIRFRCFRSRVLLPTAKFSRLVLMAAVGYLQILIGVILVATLLVSTTFSSLPPDSPSSGRVFTFHPWRPTVTHLLVKALHLVSESGSHCLPCTV